EAVFAEWGEHAVWSDGVTEVALWSPADKAYSNFYEVRRVEGEYYFRSIPRLTRRIIARGKPQPESPLQFTEYEEQDLEWRTYGRAERPVERDLTTRPRASERPPAPVPLERSLNPVRPEMPRPSLPSNPREAGNDDPFGK